MDRLIKVCDLHREDVPATASLRLVGLDKDRRLDVCEEHLEALRALPADGPGRKPDAAGQPPAAAASDRSEGASHPPSGKRSRAKAAPPKAGKQPGSRRSLQRERAVVREWARQQGRDIGDKGRLPSGLVEEYRRTQAQASA